MVAWHLQEGRMKVSESYTFQRRRIFRRRGFWSSRTSLTLVVLLGAIFGYLLPEILSSPSFGPPSFGEHAFGQVGPVSPTGSAMTACEGTACAGMSIRPAHSVAADAIGQCKVSGKCLVPSIALALDPEPGAWQAELAGFSAGAR
jgi:hypothetical protein